LNEIEKEPDAFILVFSYYEFFCSTRTIQTIIVSVKPHFKQIYIKTYPVCAYGKIIHTYILLATTQYHIAQFNERDKKQRKTRAPSLYDATASAFAEY